jgi:hypothetical protein
MHVCMCIYICIYYIIYIYTYYIYTQYLNEHMKILAPTEKLVPLDGMRMSTCRGGMRSQFSIESVQMHALTSMAFEETLGEATSLAYLTSDGVS